MKIDHKKCFSHFNDPLGDHIASAPAAVGGQLLHNWLNLCQFCRIITHLLDHYDARLNGENANRVLIVFCEIAETRKTTN